VIDEVERKYLTQYLVYLVKRIVDFSRQEWTLLCRKNIGSIIQVLAVSENCKYMFYKCSDYQDSCRSKLVDRSARPDTLTIS
jgi:hypothetical protein